MNNVWLFVNQLLKAFASNSGKGRAGGRLWKKNYYMMLRIVTLPLRFFAFLCIHQWVVHFPKAATKMNNYITT